MATSCSDLEKPAADTESSPNQNDMKCTTETLFEAFSKVSSEVDQDMLDQVNACDPMLAAVSVESVLHRSNDAHKCKLIMCNIMYPNNGGLRRRILMGKINLERLPGMPVEKLERECFDHGPDHTDKFKCGRCGQRNCTYHRLQSRCADEPETIFLTCVSCNNHWKF